LRTEGGEVLLKAGILINGLAAHRGWVVRIAGAAGEGQLEAGLASVVETHFDRDAETAAVARNEVAEAETETRRDFAEVDASGAVERVGVTADVVLAVEGNSAAGWDNGGCEYAVIVAEHELRTEAEVSAEREPIDSDVAGAKVEVDADVGTSFLEGGRVVEEVRAGAQVESCCKRRGGVEAGPCKADSRGESEAGEWAIGSGSAQWTWRGSNKEPDLTKLSASSGPGATLSAVFSRAGVCARAWGAGRPSAMMKVMSARMCGFMGMFRS
jgi:hypothetical protein